MKLHQISPNVASVEFGNAPRITVLFSYNTPVACCISGRGWFRTSKKWSVTTSKHINQWLDGAKAEERPQEFFDELAGRDEKAHAALCIAEKALAREFAKVEAQGDDHHGENRLRGELIAVRDALIVLEV